VPGAYWLLPSLSEKDKSKTQEVHGMRAKGVVGTRPDKEPVGVLAEKAKKIQKQRQERKIISGRKPPSPVPNYIAYAFLFPNYDPKTGKGAPRPLPKCRRCREAALHPQEHHTCEGFKPQFPTTDPAERHAKWEERREMIRESRLEEMRESRNSHYCDNCGEELLNEDHAIEHAEDCSRTVECPDCGEELEFMVEHECSVRECRRCGESLYWGTEHTCEP
jgi:hypothetical protein